MNPVEGCLGRDVGIHGPVICDYRRSCRFVEKAGVMDTIWRHLLTSLTDGVLHKLRSSSEYIHGWNLKQLGLIPTDMLGKENTCEEMLPWPLGKSPRGCLAVMSVE